MCYHIDILKNDFTVLSGIVKIMKECLVPIFNETRLRGRRLDLYDFKNIPIESSIELMENRLTILRSIIDDMEEEKLEIIYPDLEALVDNYIELIRYTWQYIISLDKDLCDDIVGTLREETLKIYRDHYDKISQLVMIFILSICGIYVT